MITTQTVTEHHVLIATLQEQQTRVRALLHGLDDEMVRRRVLPSGWSALGLVHHLTAMQQFWFADVLTDEHRTLPEDSGPDFGLAPDAPPRGVLAAYDREAANALEVVAALRLDEAPVWWPEDSFGGWRLATAREVVQHVVVELSTHAGHLDVVRELLDGRTWSYVLGRVATPEERVGLI